MTRCNRNSARRTVRKGGTFAELTVATLIVGILIVAALKTLGGAAQAARFTADRSIGQMLAEDLMAEILSAGYSDPDETASFGLEGTESGSSRAGYDDVDDYNNWSASPPQEKDGTAMQDKAGWRREVSVRLLDPDDLSAESSTDQGVKEITVKVYKDSKEIAQFIGIKTNHD